MKARVRCPDCGSIWHVGDSGGGEMLCPSCMTRIPLDGSVQVFDEPSAPAEAKADVVPWSADRAETSNETESAVEETPASEPETCLPDSATDPTESARITLENAMSVPEPELDLDMPTGNRPAAPIAAALAGAGQRVPAARPAAHAAKDEVICPRCSLHFVPPPEGSQRDGSPPTVLVVDDLVYFREIAKDALEPEFRVKTAATSAEARDELDKGGIDLLVLDLTLDGCQAGRDLLASLTPKPCPILIFTAKDESEMYGRTWEELQGLGADDLVMKGMKVDESLKRKAAALVRLAVDEVKPMD
jgi:CheY-like chemotaxis protein